MKLGRIRRNKQMRLIDADEFAIEEPKLWDWSSVDGISSTAVLKQCIWDVQCAPTVKAITVEWIETWVITKFAGAGRVIDALLEDWEKENEID